jgi:hypothetical protein
MWNNSFIFALANFPAGFTVARAVLTAYDRPPGKSIALGPISTQPFTTVNVDQIKTYLLYWYFQQNQCLSIKKHAVHNIHRLTWGLYARRAPGHMPSVPMH